MIVHLELSCSSFLHCVMLLLDQHFLLSLPLSFNSKFNETRFCCNSAVRLGVSVAQWLGRRTSDPAVMGSIPCPRVIRHLGQLSLPSLWGR